MNKADLTDRVAERLGISKADAARAVEAVIDAIADGVREDDRVSLAGFGTFLKRHRAGRTGVLPATRERIEIKPSTTCAFKPAPALKDSLANGLATEA